MGQWRICAEGTDRVPSLHITPGICCMGRCCRRRWLTYGGRLRLRTAASWGAPATSSGPSNSNHRWGTGIPPRARACLDPRGQCGASFRGADDSGQVPRHAGLSRSRRRGLMSAHTESEAPHRRRAALVFVLLAAASQVECTSGSSPTDAGPPRGKLYNPVADVFDPTIVTHGGQYYLTERRRSRGRAGPRRSRVLSFASSTGSLASSSLTPRRTTSRTGP